MSITNIGGLDFKTEAYTANATRGTLTIGSPAKTYDVELTKSIDFGDKQNHNNLLQLGKIAKCCGMKDKILHTIYMLFSNYEWAKKGLEHRGIVELNKTFGCDSSDGRATGAESGAFWETADKTVLIFYSRCTTKREKEQDVPNRKIK